MIKEKLWSKEMLRHSFSTGVLLLVPVCIALNVVGGQLNKSLGLPLYLDSIGTMLSAIVSGPIIGMITGSSTNIIIAIVTGYPNTIPFFIVNALIGLTTGILSYYGFFLKAWKMLVAAIIITVVVVVSAAPIVLIVFGGATGSGADLITSILTNSGMNILKSVFSMQILTNGSDKLISVIIAFGLLKSIPKQFLSKQPLGFVYMKETYVEADEDF